MKRIGLAIAALSVTAALAGCSGDDGGDEGDAGAGGDTGDAGSFAEQPAEDIVAAAKSDMGELESVKVSGTVTNDGQEITIDIQASSAGDCAGSIGVGEGTAELIGVGGDTWMRPDEAFWRASAGGNAEQVLTLVGDKWVVIPAEDDSFNQFCDVDELLDDLLKDEEEDDSTYSVTGTQDLDGAEVVLVDNEDPEEGTSTGYVLVDEPHYLVQVEKNEGEDTGSVTFSEFDEEFDVEAPAEDEVIDLSRLGG